MKQHDLALLFLAKAAQDVQAVDILLTDTRVADEIVGFHCQQAAEKLLKAVLVERDIEFHRILTLRGARGHGNAVFSMRQRPTR